MSEESVEKLDDIECKDYLELLKHAKRIMKQRIDWKSGKRIAVIGSHSIQHFVSVLRLLLYKEGILADLYEGEYNGISMDVLDENSALHKFKPNIVIIMTYYNDIKVFPGLLATKEEIQQCLSNNMSYYKNLWTCLSKIEGCHIFQTNFVLPPTRELGNLEANYLYSRSSFYRLLNQELAKTRPTNVNIVDMDTLASNVGKYAWFDYTSYFLNKTGFAMQFIGYVADLFVKQIKSLTGATKKCLVLDLDNTLWGGVVGDDGYDGIQVDPNNSVGEAYRFFQEYILGLKNRGVILAVCSKNELDTAKEPFLKNDNMIIKMDDISCFIANWEDKVSNIRRIANELNIGIDSLVFFDDNPAEREIVKKYLTEVQVVNVPEDPAYYALALEQANPFDWMQITKEDLVRSASYVENQKRLLLENSFVNYDEYLASLEMVGTIGKIERAHVERFAQLINKSNQFNLRTQRYSEAAIEQMRKDPNTRCIYVQLKDKFSDYGIISCIIIKKINTICFIDTWLMSCRILKRGVEDFTFNAIIDVSLAMHCDKIVGEYIPTKKNAMVEDFYEVMGFTKIKAVDGIDSVGTLYVYTDLTKFVKKNHIT